MELLLVASWFITGGVVVIATALIVMFHYDDKDIDNLFEENSLHKTRKGRRLK